jgi:hypothetical protein
MKKIYYLLVAAFVLLVFTNLEAQNYVVREVVVGSGGNYSDPEDYVEISTYNPAGGAMYNFGSILTQSIQDMIIDGGNLYVAAQDSIAKFNLSTYTRVAIVSAPGVNKLAIYNNKLLATFAYPNTSDFLKVYYADNLDYISSVSQISDEAAGMLVLDDLLYVAVPGGWMSTSGRIALIDLTELFFLKEVNLGTEAAGISNLYLYDNQIITVNKSAWGVNSGYLTKLNTTLSQFTHTQIPYAVGAGVGLLNQNLFLQMDGGIGEVSLSDMTLVNASVVETAAMSIAAAVLDTVNQLFYVTTTDYASVGAGYVFNMNGENVASFETGISPEAMAINYKVSSGIIEQIAAYTIEAWPNPAKGFCQLTFPKELDGAQWSVTDVQGRSILKGKLDITQKSILLDFSTIESGLYFVSAQNGLSKGIAKILIK